MHCRCMADVLEESIFVLTSWPCEDEISCATAAKASWVANCCVAGKWVALVTVGCTSGWGSMGTGKYIRRKMQAVNQTLIILLT